MGPILIATHREMLGAHPGARSVGRTPEGPATRADSPGRVCAVGRGEYGNRRTPHNRRARPTLPRRDG